MVVAPEKLDVDGVGGARLESMVAKAAESRKSTSQGFLWKVKVNVTSALKQYLIAFQARQSSVLYAGKASMFRFCLT